VSTANSMSVDIESSQKEHFLSATSAQNDFQDASLITSFI